MCICSLSCIVFICGVINFLPQGYPAPLSKQTPLFPLTPCHRGSGSALHSIAWPFVSPTSFYYWSFMARVWSARVSPPTVFKIFAFLYNFFKAVSQFLKIFWDFGLRVYSFCDQFGRTLTAILIFRYMNFIYLSIYWCRPWFLWVMFYSICWSCFTYNAKFMFQYFTLFNLVYTKF